MFSLVFSTTSDIADTACVPASTTSPVAVDKSFAIFPASTIAPQPGTAAIASVPTLIAPEATPVAAFSPASLNISTASFTGFSEA